jgi:hypothetical protein
MTEKNEATQDWLIGTIEVDGRTVPIVARGKTREEAEKQARRSIAAFQYEKLKLEKRATLLSELAVETERHPATDNVDKPS